MLPFPAATSSGRSRGHPSPISLWRVIGLRRSKCTCVYQRDKNRDIEEDTVRCVGCGVVAAPSDNVDGNIVQCSVTLPVRRRNGVIERERERHTHTHMEGKSLCEVPELKIAIANTRTTTQVPGLYGGGYSGGQAGS